MHINMTDKTPPQLVALVNDVNAALTLVFAKHAPDILEMYKEAGGQMQIDPAMTDTISTIRALIGINKALMLSHRSVLAAQEVQPEKRDLMWAAKGAVKAVKAMTYPETEQSKARLEVCSGCEKWDGKSCKMCGCYTALKVKIPEEKCPLGKW